MVGFAGCTLASGPADAGEARPRCRSLLGYLACWAERGEREERARPIREKGESGHLVGDLGQRVMERRGWAKAPAGLRKEEEGWLGLFCGLGRLEA